MIGALLMVSAGLDQIGYAPFIRAICFFEVTYDWWVAVLWVQPRKRSHTRNASGLAGSEPAFRFLRFVGF